MILKTLFMVLIVFRETRAQNYRLDGCFPKIWSEVSVQTLLWVGSMTPSLVADLFFALIDVNQQNIAYFLLYFQ
jgi:hypothetical protein